MGAHSAGTMFVSLLFAVSAAAQQRPTLVMWTGGAKLLRMPDGIARFEIDHPSVISVTRTNAPGQMLLLAKAEGEAKARAYDVDGELLGEVSVRVEKRTPFVEQPTHH